VGPITAAVARSPNADEFVTLGRDRTIRLWDVLTAQQKFEFSAPSDEPRAAAYHPASHVLACAFESGGMRVFDVETTSTLLERRMHKGPAVAVLYAYCEVPGAGTGTEAEEAAPACVFESDTDDDVTVSSPREPQRAPKASSTRLLLFTAGLDGCIVVYDVDSGYSPLKTLRVTAGPSESIRMALSADSSLLAVAGATVSTIVVYDTRDLIARYRGGQLASVTMTSPSQVLAAATMQEASPAIMSQALSFTPSSTVDVLNSPAPVSTCTPTSASTSAALISSNNAAGPRGSSELAPVTGLAFCDDRPGGALIVSTDKHIVSLPLELDGEASLADVAALLRETATTAGGKNPGGGSKKKRRSAW
jgi:WD40 repeat protein